MHQEHPPAHADIVIVGGGIMGTSTAYFLTRRTDADILLVEKDEIAAGSTGDSSAILRHHYGPQELYTKMAWWSHEFIREFKTKTGEPISYAENPFVNFATDNSETAAYTRAGHGVMSALDIPVAQYEGQQLPNAFSTLHVDDYDVAVSDTSAAYSDGADIASGFARAASKQGATIMTDVTVETLRTGNGSISGVVTSSGTIDCHDVVLTAGPWSPQLLEPFDVEIPLQTTREQVVILEPPAHAPEDLLERLPTTDLPSGDGYIRPDFGNRILVATHHTDEEIDPDSYIRSADEAIILDIAEELAEFCPLLSDSKLVNSYAGVYSTTPDHDFIIDEVSPGVYLACGFSGHGFKHGPAVGQILTDLVTDGHSTQFDISKFSLDRFDNTAPNVSDPPQTD